MNIIKFKRDTSFRNDLFTPDSFAHPAKMDSQLLIWIVEHYTEAGETILDPMFGSGTTMLACMLGRNVIGVELEQKFVDMAKANWGKVRQRPQLGSTMGTCQIIQGDARQLEGLLVDKCVFSPPFAGSVVAVDGEFYKKKAIDTGRNPDGAHVRGASEGIENPNNISNLPYGEVDKIITSPPYAETKELQDFEFMKNTASDFSDKYRSGEIKGHFASKEAIERNITKKETGSVNNPSNISNLPYGQIDKIVTSPPFQEADVQRPGKGQSVKDYQYGSKQKHQGQSPDNIANLAERNYGNIDSIITSPPYEEAMGEKHHSPRADKLAQEKSNPVTYTDRVDAVVTSPPYENSVSAEQNGEARVKRLVEAGHNPDRYVGGLGRNLAMDFQYSRADDNIGNLKSTSYLEAMLQVYQQCFAVLRDGGLLILVTKNFIREQKEVRLDSDTIALCETAGFHFQERWYRELPAQSFWRIIYRKKYPSAPELKFEDVLVFKKV